MKILRLLLSLVVFLQSVIALHGQITAAASSPASSQGADASGQMRPAIASVPLFFEANQGQADPRVRFLSRSSGYTLFLTPEETVLVESAALPSAGNKSGGSRDSKPSPRAVLRMKLLGAHRAQEFAGIGELPGKVNYLIGNHPGSWHTGVALYSQVRAEQVYPGVDLLFHGDQKQLEYDFIVSPGADPSQVAFQIEGAERIELDAQGNLVLHTPENEIAFHKPRVYQPVGGESLPIDGRFVLKGSREVGFEIAAYDRRQPLVIDPTITFATFLGGAGQDDGPGLSLDTSTPGAPKLYVGGATTDDTTFPETGSNFLTKTGASSYLFIAKIDPTLTGAASLDYLTFIGGGTPFAGTSPPCYNLPGLIALETINSTVEPLIGGMTSCQDYPVTQSTPTTGANDLVLTRLKPTGAALDLSEFFGGNGQELGGYVLVGSSGNIILSAATSSTNLPFTTGAYATKLDNGGAGDTVDCFVAKLDSSFNVLYLTYLNVGAGETISGLSSGEGFHCGALEDSTGKIIAAGETVSSTDFSGVSGQPNGFQTTFQGTSDSFVMRLDPSLSGTNQLLYSTYLGGGGVTVPNYGALLTGPNLFALVGNTTSGESGTSPNIPLANAYQTTNNADPTSGKGTGLIAVIDTTKTGSASLVCSTYLGGTLGDEKVQGLTYDPISGNFSTLRLILGGQTSSTTFPTLNPLQSSLVGGQDAWVAAMNVPATGSGPAATLAFSTYLGEGFEPSGDHKHETIDGITVDASHNIYARGRSASPSPGFFGNTSPATTVNGFQTACESCTGLSTALDDVVVFLLKSWQPALTMSPASLTFPGQLLNTTSATKSVKLTNSSLASVSISILPIAASGDYAISSDTCPVDPSTLAKGLSCTFNVTFTPTVAGSVPGEITIADTAAGSPHRVNLAGTGLTPISLSPASLTFASQTVGTTSAAKTVTLTNNLSTSLTVTGIAASGDYAVAGSGTTPCVITGITLAAKAKCTFSVTFTPEQNASAISGVATVAYSGSFSPQEVGLTGAGTGGATASPLTFTPATLSFKSTLPGASAGLPVTVKNSSTSSLSISGIKAIGNYTAAGSGTTPCGGSLGAGATCTMTVTFNPTINGTIKGAVAIANSTAVNPQIYNVSGAAILPLTFSPASLTFAAQTVGSTSAAKTVTLTNNASTTMTGISFVASGDYAAFATGATPCGASLGAHAKCTIGVTFTPSATGSIKGNVTVAYSGVAPSYSPQEMSLTGTGK